MDIPPQLIEQLGRGNVVLFVGAGLSIGAGLPGWSALIRPLAKQIGYTGSDWLKAAQFYEIRLGRQALISYLRDRLDTVGIEPTENHNLLAQLPVNTVVTTNFDDLLEQAYRNAGRSVNPVVGATELPFWDESRVNLVKLHGTCERPDSLIITQQDYNTVYRGNALVILQFNMLLATRTLLFVGYSVSDPDFNQLYDQLSVDLGRYRRRPYLVTFDPDEFAAENLEHRGFHLIHLPTEGDRNAQLGEWLQALLCAVNELRARDHDLSVVEAAHRPGTIVGKLPFKFLDYFTSEDWDIFYGRQVEAQLVYHMALSHPILTLFGQSGVGKTSLLCAGVVPLLQEEGYSYAYIRMLGDPLRAIREGVCRVLGLGGCAGDTLRDFFEAALGSEGRLVVILDQFEELLIRAGERTRKRFWRELGDCLDGTGPEVRFVLSLREDYLAELDEARRPLEGGELAPVPTVLRDSYRLTSLAADAAYLAIVEPAERARCTVEPELTDVLLGRMALPDMSEDEAQRTWSLVEADGSIPPPSLQIVMDRLYRQALWDAGHRLPPSGRADKGWEPPPLTLTLALYRRLGGASRILGEYVAHALNELSRRGGDREMAQTLLKVMVTGQATKTALDDGEIKTRMREADPDFDPEDERSLARLRATRASLVDLRLVRSFQVGEQVLYELTHDHMAAEIATWISEQEMHAKLAHELLRREMESWFDLKRLIEPTALRLIHERREALQRLDAEELEVLFRSALDANYEAAYWTKRAREGGADVDEIIRHTLQSDDFCLRAAFAAKLGEVRDAAFVSPLAGLLDDPYPQVRVAAILALERYATESAWQALLDHLTCEVYVPPGRFVMGDDDSDENDDKPEHEVFLDAFYVGRCPVTNREFKRYADDCGLAFELSEDKADHPVTGVSWYDARDYARWAGMRLLTEAEWEMAASWDRQEGAKRPYPWGQSFDRDRCNTRESGLGDTTPVGAYSARGGDSPHGCADMAGNVWEWTSSQYASYPYRSDDGREDESGSDHRVLRGGSFYLDQGLSRTVYRSGRAPTRIGRNIGFRLGLRASPPHSDPG